MRKKLEGSLLVGDGATGTLLTSGGPTIRAVWRASSTHTWSVASTKMCLRAGARLMRDQHVHKRLRAGS